MQLSQDCYAHSHAADQDANTGKVPSEVLQACRSALTAMYVAPRRSGGIDVALLPKEFLYKEQRKNAASSLPERAASLSSSAWRTYDGFCHCIAGVTAIICSSYPIFYRKWGALEPQLTPQDHNKLVDFLYDNLARF